MVPPSFSLSQEETIGEIPYGMDSHQQAKLLIFSFGCVVAVYRHSTHTASEWMTRLCHSPVAQVILLLLVIKYHLEEFIVADEPGIYYNVQAMWRIKMNNLN